MVTHFIQAIKDNSIEKYGPKEIARILGSHLANVGNDQ